MKKEIVWMSAEETNNRMAWAKSRGIVVYETLTPSCKEKTMTELRETLSEMDFPTLAKLVCDVQYRCSFAVFEVNETPIEFGIDIFLKVAKDVLSSK